MKAQVAGTAAGVEIPQEGRILLACARTQMSPEQVALLRQLLEDGVEWPYLLRLAQRHHVAPLLYWHLHEAYRGCIPDEVLSELESHYRANLYRSTFLTGELLKLVDLLAGHGISVVPLKGPVLAQQLYGNLALREFVDLDLFLRKEDVLRAKDVLTSRGYQPHLPLNRVQEAAKLRTDYEYFLQRQDGKSAVDLQWTIPQGRHVVPFDPADVWEQVGSAALGGAQVLTLAPEDLLFILCIHGAKHRWDRLSWICDVAQLLRTERFEWEVIIRHARELHVERMLSLGLTLARDLLGAPVPAGIGGSSRQETPVMELERRIQSTFWDDLPPAHSVVDNVIFHTRALDRLRDRLVYCLHFAFIVTLNDWAFLRLPAWLFPLYYVIRPLRLLGKYGFDGLRRPMRRR